MLFCPKVIVVRQPPQISEEQYKVADPQAEVEAIAEEPSFRLAAERITFAVASLTVVVLMALIVFLWITQDSQPPILSVTIADRICQEQGKYYVPFHITNAGGGTAESVQVIGELRINGKVAEQGEQQIDFLSSGEQEEGAFVFSRNPGQAQLVIRVASYKLP